MSDGEIEKAKEIYMNTKKGYWGKSKMIRKYTKLLNKMKSLQRHKEINNRHKRKMYRREDAKRPFFSVQIDLAFLPKLQSPINNNVIGFMVVIDVFSRYLWVKTFTNRKALHVPLKSVLDEMKKKFGNTPQNMTGDNEFATTKLQQLAGKYDFRWWYGDAHEKFRTGIAERVIRTIKNLVKRYLTENDTTKYINVLNDLVENYNTTYHRTIRTTPHDAITTSERNIKPHNKIIPSIKTGEHVRTLLPRNSFTKGDSPYYSKDVYEVVGRDRNRYIIKNRETNTEVKKRYAVHQLLHIDQEIIQGNPTQIAKKKDASLGYDRGISEQTRINRHKRALSRMGINLDNILDKNERASAKKNLQIKEVDKKINDNVNKQIKQYENQIKMYERQPRASTELIVSRLKKNIKNLQNLKEKNSASKNQHIPDPIPIPLPPIPENSPQQNLKHKIKNLKKQKLKRVKKVLRKQPNTPLRRSTRVRKQTEFYKPHNNILLKAEKRKIKNNK